MSGNSKKISLSDFFNNLTPKKAIGIIVIVGFIVYVRSLFNGFVWDDILFILQNFSIRPLMSQSFLTHNLYNSGAFYRPVTYLYFGVLYSIFGQNAFYYHLTQLFLHIVATVLLFTFLRLFFLEWISFFLALIFLVHPMNVESIAYISATNSELCFLFGIGALQLGVKDNLKRGKIAVVCLLLLLSVLAKETGVLFLFLILLYRYLFKLDRLKAIMLSGLGVVVIYLFLRVVVGGVTFTAYPNSIPIRLLSLSDRLINIPAIILFYLKTFVLPLNLSVWQFWVIRQANMQEFYTPLFYCFTFFLFLFFVTMFLYKSRKYHNKEKALQKFLFFSGWYIVGILPILQIIPLDMTVADRWFYFPIVGLLGLVGIGLQLLQSSHRFNKTLFVIAISTIISLFSFRTFTRTFDFKDNLTLYSHDVKERQEQFKMKDALAMELSKAGRIQEALQYENSSVSIFPTITNIKHLGNLYLSNKQYTQAISAYTLSIDTYKSLPHDDLNASPIEDLQIEDSFTNLVLTYHFLNQPQNAVKVIDEGLEILPLSSKLYLYLALIQIDLNNREEAIKAIAKSNELAPSKAKLYIYNHLKSNDSMESIKSLFTSEQ